MTLTWLTIARSVSMTSCQNRKCSNTFSKVCCDKLTSFPVSLERFMITEQPVKQPTALKFNLNPLLEQLKIDELCHCHPFNSYNYTVNFCVSGQTITSVSASEGLLLLNRSCDLEVGGEMLLPEAARALSSHMFMFMRISRTLQLHTAPLTQDSHIRSPENKAEITKIHA